MYMLYIYILEACFVEIYREYLVFVCTYKEISLIKESTLYDIYISAL